MPYYVTVDVDDVVQEPYDSANNNVPEGAIEITDEEFKRLSTGFGMFKCRPGRGLMINSDAMMAKRKATLMALEEANFIKTHLATKKEIISMMSAEEIDIAIREGGLPKGADRSLSDINMMQDPRNNAVV